VPITEDHPLLGQSPYSASKIGADQLAYSFFASFNLPVVIARPFNTYGPRQSARAIIPTIITQIASGAKQLKLGSVTPTRDFSYVQDTVDAFILTLKSDKGLGEVVNFGSNFELSVSEISTLIAEQMNAKIEITSDVERLRPVNSEVERLCADNSKVKALFGWSPKFAGRDGLARGLEATIDWFTAPENLQRYKSDIYNK
jgi:dTDP-glucose 4,6-dehydratase